MLRFPIGGGVGGGGGTTPVTLAQIVNAINGAGPSGVAITVPWQFTSTPNDQIVMGTGAMTTQTVLNTDTIAIGTQAFAANQTADISVAIGKFAGVTQVDGRASVYLGWGAGRYVQTGNSNTYLGAFAGAGGGTGGQLQPPPTGADNVIIGEAAGIFVHGSSNNNVAIGFNACYGLQVGSNNTALGINSGLNTLFVSNFVGVGTYSYWWGYGLNNVLIGVGAGAGNWSGSSSVNISPAGQNTVSVASVNDPVTGLPQFNVGDLYWTGTNFPDQSGGAGPATPYTISAVNAGNNTISLNLPLDKTVTAGLPIFSVNNVHTGSGIVAVGHNACSRVSGTATPTAVGYQSCFLGTVANSIATLGFRAMYANVSATNNVSVGAISSFYVAGSNNTAVGSQALASKTTNITAITRSSPAQVTATGHGLSSGQQVFITGATGMTQVNDRYYSVSVVDANTIQLIGIDSTLYSTYTGAGGLAQPLTGTNNTAVGGFALNAAKGGTTNNTAVGLNAGLLVTGNNNTIIGAGAGNNLSVGTNNTFLGQGAGTTTTNGSSNILIGFGITATASNSANQLNIGNAIYGTNVNTAGSLQQIGIKTSSPQFDLDVNGITNTLTAYRVATVQVVGPRSTGWTTQTATQAKGDLGAAPTVSAVAQWASAVQAALTNHGLLGA